MLYICTPTVSCINVITSHLDTVSPPALMVGFEQPSYNISEEDGTVTLFFDIEGDTMRNSIELNLTISDPSDPGM